MVIVEGIVNYTVAALSVVSRGVLNEVFWHQTREFQRCEKREILVILIYTQRFVLASVIHVEAINVR